jgi:hypothetical protein
MKSEARLGESAPSTSTPSTVVDRSWAGDIGAGRVELMEMNLGETTDIDGSGSGGSASLEV